MNKVFVVVGPTGSGKTEASLQIADAIGGEIVSADSMQLYSGMDIGTAKLMPDERKGIPHHMIDVTTPDVSFTVADYQVQAMRCIEDILSKGSVPIVCGGSGLHVNSITHNLRLEDVAPPSEELRARLSAMPPDALFAMLEKRDPQAAARVHPNNTVRVLRALEIALGREETAPYDFEQPRADFDFVIVGLLVDRDVLRDRLDERVDRMVASGLVDEVHRLAEQYPSSRVLSQAIGYKELLYARSTEDIDAGIAQIKHNTKRFAKRQMTWFRRDPRIVWFPAGDETMISHIEDRMKTAH